MLFRSRIESGVGIEGHKAFLRKMGQLDRMRTELPESAEPMVPKRWSELSTRTIALGHGLAVAPLQAMMAVAALSNGGYLITPTFLKRSEDEAKKDALRVIMAEHAGALRAIARGVLRRSDLAEDAVQAALVMAWTDLRSLRDPSRFEPWLHRIVTNACYAEARRRQYRSMEIDRK